MIKQLSFFIFFLLTILANQHISAQNISDFQKSFQYNIQPTSNKIKIDGILDEAVWTTTEIAKHFNKKYPNDIGEAKRQTEVRITYDNENLYFGFKVYDSGTSIIKGLKRDIGHDGNDGVGIMLDPQNKKTNGFYFVVEAERKTFSVCEVCGEPGEQHRINNWIHTLCENHRDEKLYVEYQGKTYLTKLLEPINNGDLYYNAKTNEIMVCDVNNFFDPWSLKVVEFIKNND